MHLKYIKGTPCCATDDLMTSRGEEGEQAQTHRPLGQSWHFRSHMQTASLVSDLEAQPLCMVTLQ